MKLGSWERRYAGFRMGPAILLMGWLVALLPMGIPASVSAEFATPLVDIGEPPASPQPSPFPSPPPAQITVTISPSVAGLTVSRQLPLTAVVQNDSTNSGVTWSLSGANCSGAACGVLSGLTATTALYTAPTTGGVYKVTATSVANVTVSISATIAVTDLSGVYTYRNDLSRSGTNAQEYLLTPSNVNSASFGKLFSCTLDGPAYTQPLWIANVAIGGGTHNVVIVGTEHDSVYAFDADAGSGTNCTSYWQASLLDAAHGATPGAIPVPAADTGETGDIPNEIGITSTPVIDPTTKTLYVVSKTKETISGQDTYVQRLHALNLTDGTEKPGSPQSIATSVSGIGDGSSGGTLPFIPLHENQRPGLVLLNGSIYTAWASHGDITPWHGWVIGQDANTLAVTGAFCATPNSEGGGIWMAGAAPTVDNSGNIYVMTSNGTYDGVTEFGDSFVKLQTSGGLSLVDWFTPFNESNLSANNTDLGSGGAITLLDSVAGPFPHLLIGGSKQGILYLLNRDNMGHIHTSDNNQAVQTWSMGHGMFSSGLFWQNTLYMSAASAPLQAFVLNTTNAQFNTSPASRSSNSFPFPGATPGLSATGTSNPIIWAVDSSKSGTNGDATGPAVLYAFDATNLANKLWDSTQAANNRDQAGDAVKFVVPTVADGKVYVGALGTLTVYGLLSALPTPPTDLIGAPFSSSQINLSWTAATDNVSVSGYLVERCQGSGCTNFAQIATPTGTSYNDTGLLASTTYSYRVRATDTGSRTSGYSNVAVVTTLPPDSTPPTAPTNLAATPGSGGQINLSWTASTDNVGVTGYLVERCQGSGCTNFAQIATPSGTTISDTGLAASTTYSYRVRATDAAGNLSSYSNIASATTSSVSGTPNLVAAYSFNEGSGTTVNDSTGNGNTGTLVNATWSTAGKYGNALSFNGTNARVTVNDSASLHLTTGVTLEAWVNPSSAPTGWRDVIYKPNDNYFLEAGSSNGNVPGSGVSLTNGSEPLAYGGAQLTTNTWTHLAMTYDGTTLKIYVNGALVNSTVQSGTIVTSTNSLQIGGDNLYGQYFAGLIDEVRIYNIALTQTQIQSDMNTAIGPSGPDTTPPTAPTNLTATAATASQINLSWTASTDNVGVTGYLVDRCQGSGCTNFAQIATPSGTTMNDTGLAASTSYSYRVRATDAAGNLSGYSGTATATTQAVDTTPPTAPTNLAATPGSGGQINLSWTASTDNVGVTGYLVERCQGSGCTNFAQIATLSGTTISDTGLAASTTYSYRVRATDAAGNLSSYSNIASATTSSVSGTPNLVAAYSFNEGSGTTVNDSTGNGNTGTLVNATWSTAGKYGNALSFNGSNARVTINDSTSLHLTTGVTLEAWVNPGSAPTGWRDVIYKPNDNYFLEAGSSNGNVPGSGVSLTNGSEPLAYGGAQLTTNTWTHLAMSYDGTTLKIYVNGALVNSTVQSGTIVTSTNSLQIGGDNLYGQYFTGLIDEVRIYNIALTQAQIQSDMNTALP